MSLENKIKEAIEKDNLEETLEKIVDQKVEEKLNEKQKDTDNTRKESKEDSAISRRSFLKKLGAGAAGLGAASLIPSASALDVKDSNGLRVYSGGTEYLDASGNPVEIKNASLKIPIGQTINDGNDTSRFEMRSDGTFLRDDAGKTIIAGQSDQKNLAYSRASQPFTIYDADGSYDAVKYTTSSSSPGKLELTNAEIDHSDGDITNFNNLIHSDSRGAFFVEDPTDGILFSYYKPQAGTSTRLDLTGQSANLRLSTGQSIEDGGGNKRFILNSNLSQICDSEGNRKIRMYDSESNHVTNIYAQGNTRIYDEQMSSPGLQYLPDSTTGTLELTNADLNVGSNKITTDNFEITENSSTNSLDFNYTG